MPFENCLWFRVFQACDYAKYTVTYICMMLCILKYDVNKRNLAIAHPLITHTARFLLRVCVFQSDVDPFMCTCGPCKKFWKDNFNDASDLLRESSISRAHNTAHLSGKNSFVKVGDRVEVHGKYPGKLRICSA